jgi:hypothetical protein
MRSRLAEGGALAMRLSLVSLNAARRGAAFFVAVEANQSFTTIAERKCRSAQIAELPRADWLASPATAPQ